MKQYKLINIILGWLVFVIASVVYILTAEPTASYWDCGEYISTAYKLQVGHPPGAPFFQLAGRFFSLFSFGDVKQVALLINVMSALFSGATIMFLFWSITALARRIKFRNETELSFASGLAVLGAGLVGALAYTFSDSFWFSAVEGEVYATSSFFTAIVFWAILKWEAVADNPQSWRWIILIAFLMGLSIGVHLLNLLAIPAITLIYYFRTFRFSVKGILLALLIAVMLLVAVMYGIIPQVVYLFARSELIFVNWFGLPFNSGTIILGILIVAMLGTGLWFTARKDRTSGITALLLTGLFAMIVLLSSRSVGDFFIRLVVMAGLGILIWFGRNRHAAMKTAILSIAFILIGYSTFLVLVIRSNAETPINENSPKDAIGLLSYLNREQYGTWPLLYGQYYCAPLDSKKPYLDGNPVYGKDEKTGKYLVIDDRKETVPNYDSRFCTIFPRMWSSSQRIHSTGYRNWADIVGTPITVKGNNGKKKVIQCPTFGENLKFFFKYQLGHMYFRYFMWNFAGRQDDIQGYGGIQNGNWLSGIGFLDRWRLGPQEDLPDYMEKNKGRNRFYMLPLILGLIGFLFSLNKDFKGWFVILWLFIMTGIAINIYLNPTPYQPRERDYAYAASFYAFSIWIGFGVLWIYNFLKKWIKSWWPAALAILSSLLLVPAIMASEGWDDHDRSNRYTVIDVASNYLNSCAPNAILFTLGDNDTFPLWYAQEVEGVRTDVRVVNLSLLGTDWYINQMNRKYYDSDPLPLDLKTEAYFGSSREFTYVYEDTSIIPGNAYGDLKAMIAFATTGDRSKMLKLGDQYRNYFPTGRFSIPVDSAVIMKSPWVPAHFKDSVQSVIYYDYPEYAVYKNGLVILDLLANFDWKRPVYFAITTGDDAYLGLQPFFQMEGLAYRVVPYYCNSIDSMVGRVNTDIMYQNVMDKFRWGNMDRPGIYLDENNVRMAANLRNVFSRLAFALNFEHKVDSAVKVCDRCVAVMPDENVPYDKMMLPIIDIYYQAGETKKANAIVEVLLNRSDQELYYYEQFKGLDAAYLAMDKKSALAVVKAINEMGQKYKQTPIVTRAAKILKDHPLR